MTPAAVALEKPVGRRRLLNNENPRPPNYPHSTGSLLATKDNAVITRRQGLLRTLSLRYGLLEANPRQRLIASASAADGVRSGPL